MTENRTTFPRRGEERVPYGGKPARSGQRRQTEVQKRPNGGTGGTGGTGGKGTQPKRRRKKNVRKATVGDVTFQFLYIVKNRYYNSK